MTQKRDALKLRFNRYLKKLGSYIGHADRQKPLEAYIKGLCLSGQRKSIEPMAALVDPFHVQSMHQSMHHFVSNAPWDETVILRVCRKHVMREMKKHGGITAWIVDDTGIPKKGTHSIGVARQYCGNVGKRENCQVSVSLSIANEIISFPAAYRLYLPEKWANDMNGRKQTGVPNEVDFQKKWEISLSQISWLRSEKVKIAPILADAGYGNVTDFRDKLTEWKIPYVVNIANNTTVWFSDNKPLSPKKQSGRGRPPTRLRRDSEHSPLSVETIAKELPDATWQNIIWREGTKGPMESRFSLLRVRSAHRDYNLTEPRDEEWLIIEWPTGESAPTKYWLSTMPTSTPVEDLIKIAKIRWRIERDYEELKGEFGLDHFEGRNWRGFHHHAALSIAAYAFMAAERGRFSPSEVGTFFNTTPLPNNFKPRGSPDKTRTSC